MLDVEARTNRRAGLEPVKCGSKRRRGSNETKQGEGGEGRERQERRVEGQKQISEDAQKYKGYKEPVQSIHGFTVSAFQRARIEKCIRMQGAIRPTRKAARPSRAVKKYPRILAGPTTTTPACKHQREGRKTRGSRARQSSAPRRRGDPRFAEAEVTAKVSVLAVRAKRVSLGRQPRFGWLTETRTTSPFAPKASQTPAVNTMPGEDIAWAQLTAYAPWREFKGRRIVHGRRKTLRLRRR